MAEEKPNFFVSTAIGAAGGEALVAIRMGVHELQCDAVKAREIGMMIVECAAAAEMDLLMYRWATERAKLPVEAALVLLREFRVLRDAKITRPTFGKGN